MGPADVKSKWFGDFREQLPRVDGKVFAITGTTSGTGFVAARTAAEKRGIVLLLNRPSERAAKSLAALKEAVPSGTFEHIDCDLQDFMSVRKAAETVRAKHPKLYCLANNAGIAGQDDRATKDGFDVQMQTNHLGHFLLTSLLLPALEEGAEVHGESRVVTHSSNSRKHTKQLEARYLEKNGGNLGGNGCGLNGPNIERYNQSKLANAVFTQALHAKLKAKGSKVKALACHPGTSFTPILDGLPLKKGSFDAFLLCVYKTFFIQSAEDGAMGLIRCVMGEGVHSGELWGPDGWLHGINGPAVPIAARPIERDPETLRLLWEKSAEASGPFSV
uniref:Uncharacterized protein n=1 Tax=Chromera velia CCMP2878 TaxID=1169474 RepID=A0A0G4HLH5_9ALVE|eukprot:Cvel_28812.t1-p1 / transcript=Cvel_28812.t1 / gene=Cvel_28812 / organism=Chromera_velia_CCMP2878 / gene_product=Uncharacterized oxidoreductase C736.13, putative / transcript_product=Uncharacterized oxidoreductase C736.13, putative / location=Cvel_scaffold3840:9334-10326(-) / protein_length=331 / sequence_SO=supercontig / SO=protein_coding / is_pseudo=false